jgi:hypothetical protein
MTTSADAAAASSVASADAAAPDRVRRLATLAAAGIVAYQVLLLVVIAVRPELDPTHLPPSEYAIGPRGRLMVLTFLTAAASYAVLLAAVRPVVRGRRGRVGAAILGVCAAGTAGAGLFVADPIATPVSELSGVGILHVVSGLAALVLLPVAAALLNLDLARGGRPGARRLRRTAFVPLAGLVGHWALSAVVPPEGWPPRLLFLTYAFWLVTLARELWRHPV